MLVREVYTNVADLLLERGGLTLGLITDGTVLAYYIDVLTDFLSLTGIAKKFCDVPQMAGIASIDVPDWMGEVQAAASDETMMSHSSVDDISAVNPNWRTAIGMPSSWRQDMNDMTSLDVYKAPRIQGNQVETPGSPLLGVIASVTAGDIDLNSTAAMLGTIASADQGEIHVETGGPFFGTIATMVVSKTNFTLIGTALPFNTSPGLDSLVELIPDSFAQFIEAGLLEKVFSTDGELKDDLRARYCGSVYKEGVALARAIMGQELLEEN